MARHILDLREGSPDAVLRRVVLQLVGSPCIPSPSPRIYAFVPPSHCRTNNPQLWRLDWWDREYVQRFDKFRRNDPWDDLESYMNWEPGSWNDRGFTVAQGDGLFKHTDRTKIWSV